MQNSDIVVFDNDDIEANILMGLFKTVHFKYIPMANKPVGYEYKPLKDMVKWSGLKPSNYMPLLHTMINNYIQNIPTK